MFGGHPESLVRRAAAAPGLYLAAAARALRGADGPRLRLLGLAAARRRSGRGALLAAAGRARRPVGADRARQPGRLAAPARGRPRVPGVVGEAGQADLRRGGSGLSSVFVGREYLGVAPLLLCVGMFAVPRRRAQRFFAGTAIASFALIVDLPGLRWIATHVPPFSLMVVHYFIWLGAFSLSLLAGLGARPAARRPPRAAASRRAADGDRRRRAGRRRARRARRRARVGLARGAPPAPGPAARSRVGRRRRGRIAAALGPDRRRRRSAPRRSPCASSACVGRGSPSSSCSPWLTS